MTVASLVVSGPGLAASRPSPVARWGSWDECVSELLRMGVLSVIIQVCIDMRFTKSLCTQEQFFKGQRAMRCIG